MVANGIVKKAQEQIATVASSPTAKLVTAVAITTGAIVAAHLAIKKIQETED